MLRHTTTWFCRPARCKQQHIVHSCQVDLASGGAQGPCMRELGRAPAHLGVADVEVAVGLGREARDDAAARLRQVRRQLVGAVADAQLAPVAERHRRLHLRARHRNTPDTFRSGGMNSDRDGCAACSSASPSFQCSVTLQATSIPSGRKISLPRPLIYCRHTCGCMSGMRCRICSAVKMGPGQR